MDKNTDFNCYGMPPFNNMYEMPNDCTNSFNSNNPMDSNFMFNPVTQYEQAYMYYRYLSMQMEYKIKCKEYENLLSKSENYKSNGRKIE